MKEGYNFCMTQEIRENDVSTELPEYLPMDEEAARILHTLFVHRTSMPTETVPPLKEGDTQLSNGDQFSTLSSFNVHSPKGARVLDEFSPDNPNRITLRGVPHRSDVTEQCRIILVARKGNDQVV